jgi:hypothetical protein
VIPTKPDAGTINTFGVRIFKRLNNVSVWWHGLGTTSLVPILAAARSTRAANSCSSRVLVLMVSDGRNEQALPTSLSSKSSLVQYTLTGRKAYVAQSLSVFSLMFKIRCERAYNLIFSFLLSIQDYETTVALPMGQPVRQIFLDMVGKRGAVVLMVSNVS